MPSGFVPSDMIEQLTPFRACMKGTNQTGRRCIALAGTPGIRTFCTIYEYRPSPCREFEVWDAAGVPNERCQQLRGAHGLSLLPMRTSMTMAEPVAVPDPMPPVTLFPARIEPDGHAAQSE